jgi:hypothetical protein
MTAAADARAWLHGETDTNPRQLVKALLAQIELVAVEADGCTPLGYVDATASFQTRVLPWLLQCFGPEVAADITERCDRFIEESLELAQALGYDLGRVPALVAYTGGRPAGEPAQEVGGVMVTLAALCSATRLDMHQAGEVELARILQPEVLEKIRAKQAAKARDIPFSPLPQAATHHKFNS